MDEWEYQTRRSRQLLEELEQQCAGFKQTAAPDAPIGAEAMTAADFVGKSVATMSGVEFNRWCDLGQPALKAKPEPKPEPTLGDGPPLMRPVDDTARIRSEINAAMGVLADVLGEEVGQSQKALREKIAQLSAEVALLRHQVEQTVIVDVPPLPLRSGGQHRDH